VYLREILPLWLCVTWSKLASSPGVRQVSLEPSMTRHWAEALLPETNISGIWKRLGGDVNHEVTWVEVCFCREPLAEERPYWEEYFELLSVKEAHARRNCRDLNGEEPWACCDCDCTKKLETALATKGDPFLDRLKFMLTQFTAGHQEPRSRH
jgi:hypothetical protein